MPDIPILGQTQDRLDREYGGVHQRQQTAQGDIHDTEILALEAIFADMQSRYGTRSFNIDAFEREAKERCHSLGFAIDLRWKKVVDNTGRLLEGVASPQVEIVGRVEKTPFDHDKKVHEVTHDYAQAGTGTGIITSSAAREGHLH